VPVEFLSDEEAAAYGRFGGPPPRAELEGAFFLDDADRALIAGHRGEHNRLGFALQLTTVRSLGLFLADPREVPGVVLDYLASQLEIADASCVARYVERRTTRFEHAEEIKRACGLRDFAEVARELEAWVDARRGRRAMARRRSSTMLPQLGRPHGPTPCERCHALAFAEPPADDGSASLPDRG
jgi:TnpA family transposase